MPRRASIPIAQNKQSRPTMRSEHSHQPLYKSCPIPSRPLNPINHNQHLPTTPLHNPRNLIPTNLFKPLHRIYLQIPRPHTPTPPLLPHIPALIPHHLLAPCRPTTKPPAKPPRKRRFPAPRRPRQQQEAMVPHYFQRREVDGRFGKGVWGALAEAGCCGVFVGVRSE